MMNNLIVRPAELLYEELAEKIIDLIELTVQRKRRFSIALSGGTTPKKLYELLATDKFSSRIPWKNVFCFFSDERMVPPDDRENNARMAIEALLEHVPLPVANIFIVKTELSPADAAADYEQRIKDFFGDELIEFELMLLGLGADGHTASLFPNSSILSETNRLVACLQTDDTKAARVSFTTRLINQAKQVIFLVTGSDKASIIHDVLYNSEQNKYPAQLINPASGEVHWYLDDSAALQIIDKIPKNVY